MENNTTQSKIKMKYKTVKDLLERLGNEGFFNNRTTLYALENKGVLPVATRKKVNNVDIRVYTNEDIDTIVDILKSLPSKKYISHA